jgi:peptidyl-prolyl cis-trans isomerase D
MLSFFRGGGAANIVISGVAFLIILAFVVEFRAGGRSSGPIKRECAVKVLDYCIDNKEFEAARALGIPSGTDSKELRKLKLDQAIVDGLIERELLVQEAEKLGISVGATELDDELEAGRTRVSLPADRMEMISMRFGLCPIVPNPMVPDPEYARRMATCAPDGPRGIRMIQVQSSKTGEFDYDIYERTVRISTNRSPKEFREMQKRALIAERMRQIIAANVRVSDAEAWAAYERTASKATARYALAKRGWFARYVVALTDAQVDEWAKANQDAVKAAWEAAKENYTAGCTLASEILVPVDFRATDDDKKKAREKIDAAAARLKKGDDFATVARAVSDGKTANIGGRVGCLNAKSYGPGAEELTAAIKDLRSGAVSPVVETTRGFHLIRRDGELAAADLETVGKREVARELATLQKAEGAAREYAQAVLTRMKSGATLEAATEAETRAVLAKALGLDPTTASAEKLPGLASEDRPQVESSMPFTRGGTVIPNAKPGDDAADQLWAMDKPGVLSTPVETADGAAVVELVEKQLAKRADFDKDKAKLMAQRRTAKAQEAVVDYVARLRKAAEKKISVDPRYSGEGNKDGQPAEGSSDQDAG